MVCYVDEEDSDDDDNIENEDIGESNNHDNDTRMILQYCAVLCVLHYDDALLCALH
jgi:hypothetical protein